MGGDIQTTDERHPVLDRAIAMGVLKMLTEELSRRLSQNPALRLRHMQGNDDTAENEALAAACASAGVSRDAYFEALRSDPALMELHRAALSEATIGTPDPGPNAQISRESPSGTEANSHYNDWMPRGNSP
jgi:hypothetical protein